ncbi:MAG: hypothetical protein ROW39_00700 [Anaerolineaceae bacterium]|jgi:hypothetical protein
MIKPFLKWTNGNFLVIVLFLLVIGIITFLPLAGELGYYRDDWHVTYGGTVFGPMRIFDQHKIDRPFLGLTYAATYAVLGNSPLAWQLFAFAIKLFAVFSLYWLARLLWPRQRVPAVMMALLLLIYPGFLQQAAAHSHQNFMLAFALMVFSIALSVHALQEKNSRARPLWIILAVLSGVTGYLIAEYMVGLEAVRGLVLGYLVWRDGYQVNLRRSFDLFKRWLPYLVVAGLYLVWRLAIFESGRPATDVSLLLSRYLNNPIGMLARLVVATGRDLVETVFIAWGAPLYLLSSRASMTDMVISVLLALAAVAALLIYLRLPSSPEKDDDPPDDTNWNIHAIWLGLGSALVALFPIILAARNVTFTDTFDRYTQPSSLGVAIFFTGAVYTLFTARARRVALSALLVVGVMTHYHNAADHRDFWQYQKDLWWQLSWRAPGIKADTTLLPLLPFGYRLSEGHETWAPANLIFNPGSTEILISAEAINRETILEIASGIGYGRNFRTFEFKVDFQRALIAGLPGANTCLQVYDGQNLEFPVNEDPQIRLIAHVSRIDLIDVNGLGYTPPAIIFGDEPPHEWCYYFQKASLARQKGDWDEVVRLGLEAERLGFKPVNVSEWMPFYEAYFRTNQHDKANYLAVILRDNPRFIRPYCLNRPASSIDPSDRLGVLLVKNLCGE